MAAKTEAQKRADEKWEENNRECANYLRARSATRSFIRKKATAEDLNEILELVSKRKEELEIN